MSSWHSSINDTEWYPKKSYFLVISFMIIIIMSSKASAQYPYSWPVCSLCCVMVKGGRLFANTFKVKPRTNKSSWKWDLGHLIFAATALHWLSVSVRCSVAMFALNALRISCRWHDSERLGMLVGFRPRAIFPDQLYIKWKVFSRREFTWSNHSKHISSII